MGRPMQAPTKDVEIQSKSCPAARRGASFHPLIPLKRLIALMGCMLPAILTMPGCSRPADRSPKTRQVITDFNNLGSIDILGNEPRPYGLDSPTPEAHAMVLGSITAPSRHFSEAIQELKDVTLHHDPSLRLLGLIVPLWLRCKSRDGTWVYHCKYDPKSGYLEIYTKEPWPQ